MNLDDKLQRCCWTGKVNGLPTIELNITYKCNLKCRHCHSGLDILPYEIIGSTDMTKDMIDEYIRQVSLFNKKYDTKIYTKMCGGEPTLHPKFEEFFDYLVNADIGPIRIISNEYSQYSKDIITKISNKYQIDIKDCNSVKTNNYPSHFNNWRVAPIDEYGTNSNDLEFKTCLWKYGSGILYDCTGFSPCVLGYLMLLFKKTPYKFKTLEELMNMDFNDYCRDVCCYCGYFNDYVFHNHKDGGKGSISWETFIKEIKL